MRSRIVSPFQNAEKFPATSPERMFSDAPPCREAVTTSFTCRECVLVKTFVNSGITAPASVPQLMIADSTHHSSLRAPNAPSSSQLAPNVTAMEISDVSHTSEVSGASQSKSFLLPNFAFEYTPFSQ